MDLGSLNSVRQESFDAIKPGTWDADATGLLLVERRIARISGPAATASGSSQLFLRFIVRTFVVSFALLGGTIIVARILHVLQDIVERDWVQRIHELVIHGICWVNIVWVIRKTK